MAVMADDSRLTSALKSPGANIHEVLKRAEAAELQLNAIHLNAAMGVLEKRHRWQEVCHTAQRMSNVNIRRDVISCNVLLKVGENWQQTLEGLRSTEPTEATEATVVALALPVPSWPQVMHFLWHLSSLQLELTIPCFNAALPRSWGASLEVLQSMRRRQLLPDEVSFCKMACQAPEGNWSFALHHLSKFATLRLMPDMVSCSSSMACLEAKWESALLQRQVQWNHYCYNSMMKGMPRWDLALWLFVEMVLGTVLPDSVSYTLLVSSLGRAGQWQQVLHVFHRSEFPRAIVAHNTVMHALVESSLWTLALSVYDQLQRRSLQSDHITYSIVLRAQPRWEMALWQLNQELCSMGSMVSCNPMLSVCGSGSLWSLALGLVGQLHRSHMKLNVIGERQMRLCLRRQWKMALSWEAAAAAAWELGLMTIGEMETQALEVDGVNLNEALNACEKGSAWSFVVALYARLRTAGACSHETISACLCAHRNRWRNALFELQSLPELRLPPQSIVLNAAVDALGRRWRSALQLLSASRTQRVAVEMFFYGSLLTIVSKGQPSKTLPLMESMRRSPDLDAVAVHAGLQGLLAARRLLEAQEWQQRMQQLGLRYHGVQLYEAMAYFSRFMSMCQAGPLTSKLGALAQGKREKRQQVMLASLELLVAILWEERWSELLSLDYYSNLVGQFSLSNVWVQMEHPLNQTLQEHLLDATFRHQYGGLLRACQEAAQKVKVAAQEEESETPEETGKLPESFSEEFFSLPRFEGSALYPCVALSNHSCMPNFTMRYSDGAFADMVAVRDIQAGDELNLAYVSPSLPLPERVASLWKTWGFVCTCRRCQDEIMLRAVKSENPEGDVAGLQLSPAGLAAAMALLRPTTAATEAEDASDGDASSSGSSDVSSDDLGNAGAATAVNAPFSGPLGHSQIPESVTKIEAAMQEMMASMAEG